VIAAAKARTPACLLDGFTFYVSPLSKKVVRLLLLHASWQDVVKTNRGVPGAWRKPTETAKTAVFTQQGIYNSSLDPAREKIFQDVCYARSQTVANSITDQTVLAMIQIVETLKIQTTDGTTVYEIGDTATDTAEPDGPLTTKSTFITLLPHEVYPGLTETDIQINFDGATILPVPGYRVAFNGGGHTCRRFSVAGKEFKISAVDFDQTHCSTKELYDRTPIVFSGDDATLSTVDDITTVGANVAVAFLGGDTDTYLYDGTIDVTNTVVGQVQMQPPDSDLHEIGGIIAAYARTTGTAVINSCPAFDGSATTAYSRRRDCVYQIGNTMCNVWANNYAFPADLDWIGVTEDTTWRHHHQHALQNLLGSAALVPDISAGTVGWIHPETLVDAETYMSMWQYTTQYYVLKAYTAADFTPVAPARCTVVDPDGVLRLGPCDNNATQFYIDLVTQRVHPAGSPFMCIEAHGNPDPEAVVLRPCAPCAVGVEMYTPCFDNEDSRQIYHPDNQTCTAADLEGVDTNIEEFCNPCRVENSRSDCDTTAGAARGMELLACYGDPNGAIAAYTCPANTTTEFGVEGGHRGRVRCEDGTATILHPGYGYSDFKSAAHSYMTHKVLLQPLSTSPAFSVVQSGLEVLNVSRYTDIFGDAYERAYFAPPLRHHGLQWIFVIVLGCMILSLLVVHCTLLFAEDRLKESLRAHIKTHLAIGIFKEKQS